VAANVVFDRQEVTLDTTSRAPAKFKVRLRGWLVGSYGARRCDVMLSRTRTTLLSDMRPPSNTSNMPKQVTFSLPAELINKQLLYSGLVKLTPVLPTEQQQHHGAGRLTPLTLPYQGFGAALSAVRLNARPKQALNAEAAQALTAEGNALCYSPGAVPSFFNDVMDQLASVPHVCSGGLARRGDDLLRVSLQALQGAPECSLRVTLAAEVPIRT
jgi:hypothetical protein